MTDAIQRLEARLRIHRAIQELAMACLELDQTAPSEASVLNSLTIVERHLEQARSYLEQPPVRRSAPASPTALLQKNLDEARAYLRTGKK